MLHLNYYLDQLIVVMFLFYSGYGIYYSIKNKERYMTTFFKKRILSLLLEFDIIVFLYYLVGRMIGKDYSAKRLLFSFAGWKSVGNSNWYIFSIFILYLITLVSYMLFQKRKALFILSHVILTALYIITMMRYKESFWYNTVCAYVFGIFWGCYKDEIDELLKKKTIFLLLFVLSLITYHFSRTYSPHVVLYEIMSVSFALIVLLVTKVIRFGNAALHFLGKNLFPLYMLQRLPMIVLSRNANVMSDNAVFMLCCALLTILLTYGYVYIKQRIKSR